MEELDHMELSNEYNDMNSLNIFSLTLGPFEKDGQDLVDDGMNYDDDEFINQINDDKTIRL